MRSIRLRGVSPTLGGFCLAAGAFSVTEIGGLGACQTGLQKTLSVKSFNDIEPRV